MELSWLMRLRIAAAVGTGAVLIGILGWPLAAPAEPFGVVSLVAGSITVSGAVALATLAFLAGFIGYFLTWPYGREIGILAVPSGLAVWAVRGGSMGGLMQLNPSLAQRQVLFAMLKWEPIFWLAIVAAGFSGVLIGQKIGVRTGADKTAEKRNPKSDKYLSAIFAVIASGLMSQFFIGLFAHDVRIFDNQLGLSVVAQPAVGQIVFAVLVSFGLAGFIVKKFLNVSYIWPTIASALVTGFAIIVYVKENVLEHLVQHWPGVFFSRAVVCVLPVQMVAFGTIGSIVGYWLAVRYNYWRKHR